jgi:hypothetical protein
MQGSANGKSAFRVLHRLADGRGRTCLWQSRARRPPLHIRQPRPRHRTTPASSPPFFCHTPPTPPLFPFYFHRRGMARLNTHLSATPQTRASTVDSLYRDPSVAPRNDSNARTQSYSVLSPARSMNSDKENEQPETRANTPRRGKAGGLRSASVRMPTPDSGSTTGNGGKRRRTDNYTMATSQIYEDGQDEHQEEQEDNQEVETPSQPPPESDEEDDLKCYNPNQDPEQRRRLRANMRDHQRMLDGELSNMVHAA